MGIQKALASLVASVLVILTPFVGELDPQMMQGIQGAVALLGTVLVYLITNK